ncbi:MAG: PqqD family protein [Gaiellales bacterium]
MTTTNKIEASALIARNSRVAFHPLTKGEGGVLLHLDTGAYHGVNDIGLLIWQLLDEQRRFDELLSLLGARVEGTPPTLDMDISAYVNDLLARDLVRLTDPDA